MVTKKVCIYKQTIHTDSRYGLFVYKFDICNMLNIITLQ